MNSAPDRGTASAFATALPCFSVVTCSYNQGGFIADTIESVRQQDYPNFEHLVVDGGSTDDTRAVCARYPHVRFLDAPGTNQSQALNIGFRAARGDIIGWLNSDDFYAEQAFFTVATVMASAPRPHIVTGNATVVSADRRPLHSLDSQPVDFHRLLFHPRLYRLGGRMCMPCQPATFFSRGVLQTLGPLNESLNFAMDYEYWLRALCAGYRFEQLVDRLAYYRYHASSKTVQDGYDRFLPEWTAVSERCRRSLSPPARLRAQAWWLAQIPAARRWSRRQQRRQRAAAAAAPHPAPGVPEPWPRAPGAIAADPWARAHMPFPAEPPLVSIIVPVFNAAAHLEQTLDSVFQQVYPAFEVLVVDDGSRDGSRALAERIAARHSACMRVLTHPDQANHGVSAARNLAIALARGRYIAFLDADDRWLPGKLAEQVFFMEQDPGIGLSHTGARIVRTGIGHQFLRGSLQLGSLPTEEAHANVLAIITGTQNYVFSTVMVRTECLRTIGGFDEQLPFQSEDRILVAKIASRHRIGALSAVLCEYFVHDASYTARILRGRLARVLFFDLQVRVLQWLATAGARRALAEDLAVRVLPASLGRALLVPLPPRFLLRLGADLALILRVFPGLPVTWLRWTWHQRACAHTARRS